MTKTWMVVQVSGFAPTNGMIMGRDLTERRARNLADRLTTAARPFGGDIYTARQMPRALLAPALLYTEGK